ncbi:MAG: class I SAM-dependent rRNA methyltransferase [Myxococcota bacterium]|nr:class I SAM-dependent rRNA methyltransferase [Myxococcota bacterium]
MSELTLVADAVGPVSRGHPWVYRDGLRGSAEVGSVVTLRDPRGGNVGWGLFDEGPIAVRVLGRESVEPLSKLISRRLSQADALRTRTIGADTTGYRVVNGAGDGLPEIVVDRYGGLAVLRLYSQAWEPHVEDIVEALSGLGWVETIFRRFGVDRVDGKQGGETLWGPAAPECMTFLESGLTFIVRPGKGQKTGFFLDQRENRKRIGALSPGRRMVNLFSYTGGFSVYAAVQGAARTISVDISEPAMEDARENFRLNGLDVDRHVFLCTDVFSWNTDERFDLVVCDPPNLARRRESDRSARGAYKDLARRSGRLVSSGGLLATASCTARLTRERWEQSIYEGLSPHGEWDWLEHAGAGMDHPVALGHAEGRYLKFALLRHRVVAR